MTTAYFQDQNLLGVSGAKIKPRMKGVSPLNDATTTCCLTASPEHVFYSEHHHYNANPQVAQGTSWEDYINFRKSYRNHEWGNAI